MTEIIKPNASIIYMKVGLHAQESLADIIKRKTREIQDAGYAMWGYGGNTCHPLTMVQPFSETAANQARPIHLCMEEMASKHAADPLRANEYSSDGVNWNKVPEGINVLGSKYALCIEDLRTENFSFLLDQTQVSVGKSQGRVGRDYIKGRVDKACLEFLEAPQLSNIVEKKEVRISLVAKLRTPYAVFLRDHR